MQVSGSVRITLLIVAFAAPALVFAQFQTPTREELKMTVDPAYPDAAAVYLNHDFKTDDLLHFRSEYVRIKVLKESAKELATVHLGYFKGYATIAAVDGRTIHPFEHEAGRPYAREGRRERDPRDRLQLAERGRGQHPGVLLPDSLQ